MIIFGLTGSIACGKSTVSNILSQNGVSIIDADLMARKLVEPNTPGLQQIISQFGEKFLLPDGTLNRKELGAFVFSHQVLLSKLNKIMDPLIRAECNNQINLLQQQGQKIICYDAALIIEMDEAERFRPLVVVTCEKETQIIRLMSRNGLTRDEALLRINAQFPVDKKIQAADFIIENNGSLEDLTNKTISILNKIKESHEIQ